jgi:hypothetical protein
LRALPPSRNHSRSRRVGGDFRLRRAAMYMPISVKISGRKVFYPPPTLAGSRPQFELQKVAEKWSWSLIVQTPRLLLRDIPFRCQ